MSFPRFRLQTSKPSRLEDDIVPLTDLKSTPVSRNNSFAMKTLNPRSLSIRLKNRSGKSPAPSPSPSPAPYETNYTHASPVYRPHIEPLPSPNPAAASVSTGGGNTRAEFIYKPIRRTDYVAETVTSQSQNQSQSQSQRSRPQYQYNYISPNRSPHLAAGTWGHAGLPAGPAPQSQSRSRAQAQAQLDGRRDSDLYNDLDIVVPRARAECGYTDKSMYSAAEKKRRAARRLTTVMVPDAEDIYG